MDIIGVGVGVDVVDFVFSVGVSLVCVVFVILMWCELLWHVQVQSVM